MLSFHIVISLKPCRSRVRYISAASQESTLSYWPWSSVIDSFLTMPSIWVNLCRSIYSTEYDRLVWQDDKTILCVIWLQFHIKLHFGPFSSLMSTSPSLSSNNELKAHLHLCFQCRWTMSVPPFLLLALWIERPAPLFDGHRQCIFPYLLRIRLPSPVDLGPPISLYYHGFHCA